jgi:two-component system response regulator HydG
VFTSEFLERLVRHPWPGNVRQLRNLIERLVVTVRETEIGVEHAPPIPSRAAVGATGNGLFSVQPGQSIAEVEARLIRETLARVTSNRREAAKVLGISPRALAYKLKLLRLTSEI